MIDPRTHRHARGVDGNRITYVCGCVNEVHAASGVLRSVSKCEGHRREQREPAHLGRSYYEGLGTIAEGVPRCAAYLAQLREAMGPFPCVPPGESVALEVGCGCSMYAPGLIRRGFDYVGLEPNEWAARWTASTFDVPVLVETLESATLSPHGYDLILSAHTLEHLADAPAALATMHSALRHGGELWLLIPDDTDPLNPDHLWFFSERTLRACLERAGFVTDLVATRKYIDRENFLYCRARRPFPW